MDHSEEYIKMEMESEPKKSFWRGHPCSSQTGILVLLGTVGMIIFMIMTFVIYSKQERNFSELKGWMNSHTSDLTSVKSDFQITGTDLEKKVSELQNLVSNFSSYLNMSGSRNPMTNEVHEKKLSNIETLMADLGSSLSSLTSKQEENQQKLEHQQDLSHTEVKNAMDSLSFAVSALRSHLSVGSFMSAHSNSRIQQILADMSSSLMDMKSSMEGLRSLFQSVSYKLSLTNLFTPGCIESDWIPFSNSCYLFSSDSMNWTQAKDYCEKQGALLLKTEDSEKEWEFVTHLTKPFQYWIGLTDQTTGQWRWADDTPCTMDKVHWGPGQPDKWQGHREKGGEECAHITYSGTVNDNHCAIKMRFICKVSKDS
ncbi:asialoglycoprotein receptor 1-like isoform X1 [Megalobrama amblycephala]|uniref:asialoglycoprotein receptor 1-like isoform X1 n=2 Tax=Megalobrama amblycephala TaxID=75352 RepID=UPI002013CF71|nr:asialoglycoprotein receptor 1-like isoform X1 [Megalobrama amblycephala]XP_048042807.1 asialoglycoprotein receptor 1-like isoform X1 [Megalobrama amblycephala]